MELNQRNHLSTNMKNGFLRAVDVLYALDRLKIDLMAYQRVIHVSVSEAGWWRFDTSNDELSFLLQHFVAVEASRLSKHTLIELCSQLCGWKFSERTNAKVELINYSSLGWREMPNTLISSTESRWLTRAGSGDTMTYK